MFKEIAIEPSAVASSYRDFAYIIEKFGIPEGRLIAAFPSKWKRFVYQAAQMRLRGTTDLSRIEVRLGTLQDETFYWRGRPGNGCAEDWLGTAIAEHARDPFDAIIATTTSQASGVVAACDLDGQHPCMHPNRQWHIDRDAEVMASCCAPLLSRVQHVKLIDPYFDLSQARFRRPFTALLKHVQPGTEIEVFRGDNFGGNFAQQSLQRLLDTIKPDGIKVAVFFLPQKAMHNRFVLTEAGGLVFKTGLDDKDDGELTTDLVTVLERDVWAVEWAKFTGDEPVAAWP